MYFIASIIFFAISFLLPYIFSLIFNYNKLNTEILVQNNKLNKLRLTIVILKSFPLYFIINWLLKFLLQFQGKFVMWCQRPCAQYSYSKCISEAHTSAACDLFARRAARRKWDAAQRRAAGASVMGRGGCGHSPRKIQCFDIVQASANGGKLHFLWYASLFTL